MRWADLGLRVTLSVALGIIGGLYLDRHTDLFGRIPGFTLIGFLLGLAGGLGALFHAVAKAPAERRRDDPPGPGDGV